MNVVRSAPLPVPGTGDQPTAPDDQSVKTAGPRYPGFWALSLLWTAVGVVTSTPYYIMTPAKLETASPAFLLAGIAVFYPWVPLTMIVFRLEARFPLGGGRWPSSVARLAICSVPLCLVASPLMVGCALGVLFLFGSLPWMPPGLGVWSKEVFVAQMLFWCAVAGGYIIRTRFQLREQERRVSRLALEKSRLEAGLNQAQLDVLRARLNPHFLFNSLQNISVMTREDAQVASRMLTRLGDLLRSVLRQDSRPEITLEEEIELTQSYVAIEQMRFGDRLRVAFNVGAGAQAALVPCFLLQPLVENAIVHGLRGVRQNGEITVSAATEGDELVVTVADNGIGPPSADGDDMKIGVGLASTRGRLAKMYPERHTFSMQRPPEGGAQVRITIPLRFGAGEDRDDDEG